MITAVFILLSIVLTSSIVLIPIAFKSVGKASQINYIVQRRFAVISVIFSIFPFAYILIRVFGISERDYLGYEAEIFSYTHDLAIVSEVILVIWLMGIVIEAVQYLKDIVAYYRLISNSIPIDIHTSEIASACCHEVGIKRTIHVISVYGINTPVLFGFIKSKIILPAEKAYTDDELRLIFYHELIHGKHNDMLLKSLTKIACLVQWFNPLVTKGLTNYVNMTSESYCDYEVCKHTGDVKGYCDLLLRESNFTKYIRSVGLPFFETQSILPYRLTQMQKLFKKDDKCHALSVVVFTAICLVSLWVSAFGAIGIHQNLYDKTLEVNSRVLSFLPMPQLGAVITTTKNYDLGLGRVVAYEGEFEPTVLEVTEEEWTQYYSDMRAGKTLLTGPVKISSKIPEEGYIGYLARWFVPAGTTVRTEPLYFYTDTVTLDTINAPKGVEYGIIHPDGKCEIFTNEKATETFDRLEKIHIAVEEKTGYRFFVRNNTDKAERITLTIQGVSDEFEW